MILTSPVPLDLADAVGSASFHPLCPLVLTVSGSRHFDSQADSPDSDSESDASSTSGDDGDCGGDRVSRAELVTVRVRNGKLQANVPTPRDASVKLWEFEHPASAQP